MGILEPIIDNAVFRQILEEVADSSLVELRAYLAGAHGDATFNARHRTVRYGQSDPRWLTVLSVALERLGFASWTYREGRDRDFWILETTAAIGKPSHLAAGDPTSVAYVRGFFDAEGGMPASLDARLYFQFAQKDHRNIALIRELLQGLGIACGAIGNPSHRVDPNYWRFFVRAGSHRAFLSKIGSWHPRKRPAIEERLRRIEFRSGLETSIRGRNMPR